MKKTELEVFDPNNPEHRKAYFIMRFHNRQHPTLRFKLLPGYMDIPSMMLDRLKYTAFDQQEIEDVINMRFDPPQHKISYGFAYLDFLISVLVISLIIATGGIIHAIVLQSQKPDIECVEVPR